MLVYKDLDKRQQRAFRNIEYTANDYIGGIEDLIADYAEDSEGCVDAKEVLSDYNRLVEFIYREATTNLYELGSVIFGKAAERELKDIKLCGKEWLIDCVKERLERMGYTNEQN